VRCKGIISDWNEERGFGFIQPAEGGGRVFLHIKAIRDRTVRPINGKRVTYELGCDDRGRPRAENVRDSLTPPTRWPRKVTLDGHVPSHCAVRLLRRENPKWNYVEVRCCKYLNNIVEQDHRAIKRRCVSMAGFKSFANASITISGIELAHRIHKRQFSLGPGHRPRHWSLKQQWERALAWPSPDTTRDWSVFASADAPEP